MNPHFAPGRKWGTLKWSQRWEIGGASVVPETSFDGTDRQKLLERWTERTVRWIRERVEEANCSGTVLGVSGGLDSAAAAALCQRAYPDNALAAILPCESDERDMHYGRMLVDTLNMECIEVSLDESYGALLEQLPSVGGERGRLARANIKPRLRMTALYYLAQSRSSLVVGAANRAELYLGYFTKHGDSGSDLLPLGRLVKSEVEAVAAHLGVPQEIIDRPPTAGLWPGQTDEEEMGMSYAEVDRYLLRGWAEPEISSGIESAHRRSEHKRKMPPLPPFSLGEGAVRPPGGEDRESRS